MLSCRRSATRRMRPTSAETLDGGGGNDTLVSGTGADIIGVGAGRDTADYGASTDISDRDVRFHDDPGRVIRERRLARGLTHAGCAPSRHHADGAQHARARRAVAEVRDRAAPAFCSCSVKWRSFRSGRSPAIATQGISPMHSKQSPTKTETMLSLEHSRSEFVELSQLASPTASRVEFIGVPTRLRLTGRPTTARAP